MLVSVSRKNSTYSFQQIFFPRKFAYFGNKKLARTKKEQCGKNFIIA